MSRGARSSSETHDLDSTRSQRVHIYRHHISVGSRRRNSPITRAVHLTSQPGAESMFSVTSARRHMCLRTTHRAHHPSPFLVFVSRCVDPLRRASCFTSLFFFQPNFSLQHLYSSIIGRPRPGHSVVFKYIFHQLLFLCCQHCSTIPGAISATSYLQTNLSLSLHQ